ncbi:unnamed protein product [Alternaria alternata]
METVYVRRVHEIVEYLVPTKIDHYHFGTSRLPLIQAVGQGDLHWVRQLLLKTDTDINTRSWQGWTALQQACSIEIDSPESRNQEAIIRLLITEGADVNAARGELYNGRTALQAACERGNERIVDLLLERGAQVHEDVALVDGKSALACVVEAGHFGIAKKLLDRGADINHPAGKEYNTALMAAIQANNPKMFNFLIENGASTQGSAGLSALKDTIRYHRLDMVRHLLDKGVDVNSCANGPAPLHSVSSIDMLNLLITYGARFDLPGSEASGWTALQRAAKWWSPELATELVRLGSDVHHPGPARGGRSALQAAAAGWRYGMKNSVLKMSFFVEEHGADVNEPRSEEDGYTSLEAACHATIVRDPQQSIDGVKFLIGKGAIITPFTLHVAAAWNRTKLLDFLLQNGARTEDINSPTNVPIVEEHYGDYRDFGPNVIETARINGHLSLAEALENWSPSTQLEMQAGEEYSEREDSDWEDSD